MQLVNISMLKILATILSVVGGTFNGCYYTHLTNIIYSGGTVATGFDMGRKFQKDWIYFQ